MATLGSTATTYLDWGRRIDPDGKIARIIDILSQTNEILDTMLTLESNEATGHVSTQRTGLPQATWRLFNQGVQPTKSTTAQVKDTCGMLETQSQIDVALAKLNGNTAEFRLSEDVAFLEGMNQQMAAAIFYSNSLLTPQQILGLAPRYATVNTLNAQTANNVIDCGGTGSTNTSIYLLVWGPNYIHGIFPKATKAGLDMIDLSEGRPDGIPVFNPDGSRMLAYLTHFKWLNGLCVRDWRYGARAANIDVTQLANPVAVNLLNVLIKLVHKLPTTPIGVANVQKTDAPGGDDVSMGQTFFYVNRTLATYLDIQAVNGARVFLKEDEWHGKAITTFRKVPIMTVDQIVNTEARVI